jgi:hypothetical protein
VSVNISSKNGAMFVSIAQEITLDCFALPSVPQTPNGTTSVADPKYQK